MNSSTYSSVIRKVNVFTSSICSVSYCSKAKEIVRVCAYIWVTTDSVEHVIDKSAYKNEEETVSDVTSLYRLIFAIVIKLNQLYQL